MTRMKRARCPTCKVNVDTDPETRPKDYPFCSERCRLVDLHRWFSGDYRIPVGGQPDEAPEPGEE